MQWILRDLFNLNPAVGHARVSGWQRVLVGATTLQANACEAEQRPRARCQWFNLARSADTLTGKALEGTKASVHAAFLMIRSGQLPDLGLKLFC